MDMTETAVDQRAANGLAISVLDLVAMRTGEPAGSAIARTVELARQVEQWGYRRYWLAEHHSIAGLACSATSVLIGHVAGSTTRIGLAHCFSNFGSLMYACAEFTPKGPRDGFSTITC